MLSNMCHQRLGKVQFIVVFVSIMLLFAQVSSAFPPPPGPKPHPAYRPRPIRRPPPPIPYGRVVHVLPVNYIAFVVAGALFYSHAGSYYRRVPSGYEVVAAPTQGAVRQPVTLAGKVKVATKVLNVRVGPGVHNAIISKAHSNTILQIIGNAPGWYYVQLPDGTIGWVMAKFTVPLIAPSDG